MSNHNNKHQPLPNQIDTSADEATLTALKTACEDYEKYLLAVIESLVKSLIPMEIFRSKYQYNIEKIIERANNGMHLITFDAWPEKTNSEQFPELQNAITKINGVRELKIKLDPKLTTTPSEKINSFKESFNEKKTTFTSHRGKFSEAFAELIERILKPFSKREEGSRYTFFKPRGQKTVEKIEKTLVAPIA